MIDTCVFQNQRFEYAATGGSSGREISVKVGGNGKTKATYRGGKGRMPWNAKSAAAELCRKQGISEEIIDRLPFRKDALCKAIGNGVPLPMGRAIAKAVMEATEGPRV